MGRKKEAYVSLGLDAGAGLENGLLSSPCLYREGLGGDLTSPVLLLLVPLEYL